VTFLNTLAWWQWLILGGVPIAILLLYFLKLRRHPIEVPSTYLWSRTLEDLHVNSIWQRLRRNLLLFLQLLIIALLAMALRRPGWQGVELKGERFIFLVDVSASMNAVDQKPTRLQKALERVGNMIDQMTGDNEAMLLSSSNQSRVELPYTSNRALLKRKLRDIKPTNRLSDIEDALRYAEGLANPGRSSPDATDVQAAEPQPATIYILSDGGFSKVPNFFLGNLEPVYMPVGNEDCQNVAILAFSAERNSEKPDQMQAYARLENFGDEPVEVEVSLLFNGQLADAKQVRIGGVTADDPGASTQGVEFELRDVEEGELTLRVDIEDDMPLDNAAYAVLNPPRRARVLLVTQGNDSLELCLSTEQAQRVAELILTDEDFLTTKEYEERAAGGEYDLVIYDRCAPPKMPEANTFFIGRVPPGGAWKQGERQGPPIIIDTDRAHPLMQLVEMGNVRIVDATPLTTPEGGRTLLDSDIGNMLAVAQRGNYEDVVLGFEIIGKNANGNDEVNTNWPIRRSYPVFFMNAVRYLGGSRTTVALPPVIPGEPASLQPLGPVDRLTVVTPSGKRETVLRDGDTFVFTRTEELGFYNVFEGTGDQPSQRFAVNLFDRRESNIRPESAIKLEYETVNADRGAEPTRQEIWKWLLIVALIVLMVEWYIYNRRVYL